MAKQVFDTYLFHRKGLLCQRHLYEIFLFPTAVIINYQYDAMGNKVVILSCIINDHELYFGILVCDIQLEVHMNMTI